MRRALAGTESGLTIGIGYEGEVDQVRISGGQLREPEMEETVIAYAYNARNQLVRRVEEEASNGNRPWWARLASRTYTFYTYDRNGNMRAERSFGGKTESKYHSYDKLNRMTRTVSVKGSLWAFWRRPEINVETHEYAGAEWRRVANTANGKKTSFVYDGDNVVVDKQGGEATRQYVTPFLDQNLTMTVLDGEQQGTYYYNQDGLGSVRTLTDSTGTVVNRYDYTAFGQPHHTTASQGHVPQRYTYTGRENTTDPTLMYYRYRMYAPGVGNFATRDPIGYFGGTNVYQYAFARVVNLVDFYGLEPEICAGLRAQRSGAIDLRESYRSELKSLEESILDIGSDIDEAINYIGESERRIAAISRANYVYAAVSGGGGVAVLVTRRFNLFFSVVSLSATGAGLLNQLEVDAREDTIRVLRNTYIPELQREMAEISEKMDRRRKQLQNIKQFLEDNLKALADNCCKAVD